MWRSIIRSLWLILAIVALIVSAGFNDLLWFELDGRFSYPIRLLMLLMVAWLLRRHILAWAPRHSRVFHCPEGSEWLGEEFAELRPNILVAQWLAEFPAFREKWKLKTPHLERLTEDVVNLIQRDRVHESLSFDGNVLRRRVEISFKRVDLLPLCVLSRPKKGDRYAGFVVTHPASQVLSFSEAQVLLFGLTLQAVAATRLNNGMEELPSREALACVAEVISSRLDASDLVRPAFLALTGETEPVGNPQIRLWNLLATAAALRVMFCHSGRASKLCRDVAFEYLELPVARAWRPVSMEADPWLRFKAFIKHRANQPPDTMRVPITRALSSSSYSLVFNAPPGAYVHDVAGVDVQLGRCLPMLDREAHYKTYVGWYKWPGASAAKFDSANLGASSIRDPYCLFRVMETPPGRRAFSLLVAAMTWIVLWVVAIGYPHGASGNVDLVTFILSAPAFVIGIHNLQYPLAAPARSFTARLSLWASMSFSLSGALLYLGFDSKKLFGEDGYWWDMTQGKTIALVGNWGWAVLVLLSFANFVWIASKLRIAVLRYRSVSSNTI